MPTRVCHDDPADGGGQQGRQGHDHHHQADHPGIVVPLEEVPDQGWHGHRDRRPTRGLGDARPQQGLHLTGQGAAQGPEAEQEQAATDGGAPAEHVRQRTHEQLGQGEDREVGGDRELGHLDGRVQVLGDGRQAGQIHVDGEGRQPGEQTQGDEQRRANAHGTLGMRELWGVYIEGCKSFSLASSGRILGR